ncbi:Protein N-acetyltransferase, RimJ/RimL family [Pseudoxanthomonas sp. GM95]|uniref:GNAT family N-acetyltransferase n=1 Tax=Pseudoxanthomonas sp. GM95 TaxID=1881043 RepID=UPI0008D4FE1C|nr:GNAT family N-acetyltransferase [Pseudoxanthomonas sp. GM95]SEL90345.1 Protein N-acetyltransferase, RimJ/RimL family [Pseudoxanthomonas sp. GM95]
MSAVPASIRAWREVPTLSGAHVRLVPLAAAHADGLRAIVADGVLPALWYTGVPKAEAIDDYIATTLASQARGECLPFTVLDGQGNVAGATRFYDLDASVPRLSIGYTWYAPRVQRTGLNTEAKRLLLGHAFEAMAAASVVLETSWFNHASRTAIARLGARQDGVLRAHKRHADGSLRDTVIFSILDHEWPAVRTNLQHRLDQYA